MITKMIKRSIFDSKSEEKLYSRLKTFWSQHADIFPQLPPRNVFGYENIINSELNDRAKDYLLKTSFDFIVCDIINHAPLLVIEFDGLTSGFSREGIFYRKNHKRRSLSIFENAIKVKSMSII